MGRYFLHVETAHGRTRDSEGYDLPSMEAARQEALQAAREILSDALRSGRELEAGSIAITDEAGSLLGRVSFSDALPMSWRQA